MQAPRVNTKKRSLREMVSRPDDHFKGVKRNLDGTPVLNKTNPSGGAQGSTGVGQTTHPGTASSVDGKKLDAALGEISKVSNFVLLNPPGA